GIKVVCKTDFIPQNPTRAAAGSAHCIFRSEKIFWFSRCLIF
ncbi:MAG: hypothetical protein ACI9JY_001303, partial [Saprospiraceae bacterium]